MPSTEPSTVPSRRRHKRHAVFVNVRWHNRVEEGARAEIYDVSAEGSFLAEGGSIPEDVRPGDPVWIVVPTAGSDVTLTGTIRWRGYHPAHGIVGCGIQFDDVSPEQLALAFPAMNDD